MGLGVLNFGVRVESEVVLPDGSRVSGGGSPTVTLRRHVVNELFAPSPMAVVQPVDRVCIVSIGGVLEDCTTSLSFSSFIYGINNYVVCINGYVTVSGSYMFGYVRIKAGDVVYFESSAPFPFYVFPGQVVSFTICLIFSTTHSPSVGGGLPGIMDVDSSGFLELLADILRGARPANTYLTLERVRWEEERGETILDVPLSRSYTSGATSGSAFHDFANFVASGNLYRVYVDCVGKPYCISYTLSSALSVTTADRARFSIVIDVGYSLDLSDSVSLGLDDVWSYDYGFFLDDSVDMSLSDGWGWSVGFDFGLSDSVGLGLVDGWIVWMDEIQLVSFAGVGVFYPAIADVVDFPAVVVSLVVSYPAVVDVVDVGFSSVSVGVSYPAVVDVVDLVVGVGVSVG